MKKETRWAFREGNTVREQRDGSLSCDCVEYARFGYCPHIAYIEARYKKQEVIKVSLP